MAYQKDDFNNYTFQLDWFLKKRQENKGQLYGLQTHFMKKSI
jgi:hypothetical protein